MGAESAVCTLLSRKPDGPCIFSKPSNENRVEKANLSLPGEEREFYSINLLFVK